MNEEEVQRKRRQNEEESTSRRARILGLAYLDTREFEASLPLVRDIIDVPTMHSSHIIPLQAGDDTQPFQFIVTSQTPKSTIDSLFEQYDRDGYKTEFFLVSNSAYNVFMLRHDPPKEIKYDNITIAGEGDSETIEQVSQTFEQVSPEKVFNYLLDQADMLGASDIHIENMRSVIRIRMRVDGILHPVAEIGRDRYRILLSELSSRANISTASATPQSGHMQTEIHREGATHLLNIRVEAIPTMYGLDAVLRLFNFDDSLLNIDLLGLSEEERDNINDVISHPRGLVLMVGPTGSGKSTTLYSILNALNSSSRKIITLEDPIEYGIPGISQIPIQTNNGGSFADGLRSVLRLDPDVVMVGEIRDQDTAKTAIQASITGHLVLSSFHANSTSAAFTRMVDMIGKNPIFASSVRLVMAQRLVRKLDENKEAYTADKETASYIRKVMKGVKTDFDLEGEITLWREKPSKEHPFGFDGRIAIMEQLIIDEKIQRFISGGMGEFDAQTIEAEACRAGMLTLEQKGILAALRGDTTLDEIARVV